MSCAGAALREIVIIPEIAANTASVTMEDLVRAHAQTVFRVAYSLVRNHADAEDVVQETFLRVLKHGRMDKIENHRAWLVKIAWRLALDRAKKIPVEPLDDVMEVLRSNEPLADDAIHERQRGELLRQLLQSLPADLRKVTVLSTVEEMTSADIAGVLGIPDGSVRSRLMRARQMMKEKLAAMLEKK